MYLFQVLLLKQIPTLSQSRTLEIYAVKSILVFYLLKFTNCEKKRVTSSVVDRERLGSWPNESYLWARPELGRDPKV